MRLHRNEHMNCRFLILFVVIILFGCRAWQNVATEGTSLPPVKLAPDSIGVELTFVRIPMDDESIIQSIWAEADEQCVPGLERSHHHRNGVRCGIVNQQLPTALRKILDQNSQKQGLNGNVVDLVSQTKQQQWRFGKRAEIIATEPKPEFIFLHSNPDSLDIVGRTFENGQGIFGVKAFAEKDGTVRFELIPEIHHGAVKNQWIANQGSIQMKAGKDREVLSDLIIKTALAPGQTLLVGCTSEICGLGASLFADRDSGEPHQKMFLLRLTQLQKDDLFDQLMDE